MPTLLSLPAELHLQIIKATDVYDLEALWTSCKTFYAYGKEKLQANVWNKANYRNIRIGWANGFDYESHPLFDLGKLLDDEEVRFYPRVMVINGLSYDNSRDNVWNMRSIMDGAHRILSKHGDRITTIVSEVHRQLLPDAPIADAMAWNKEIQDTEPAAIVILLLALYPHLESLHIYNPGQDWWTGFDGPIFSSLTAAAMSSATNTLGVFSKLSAFSSEGRSDIEGKEGLFNPFMALPAMRSIEARYCTDRYVKWPWGRGFSQVNELKLDACDIDTDTVRSHIYGVKALGRFTYTFYPSGDLWHDEEGNPRLVSRLEPRAILACLQLHACDTLTFLELTACNLENSKPFQNGEPYIGSLRAFKVLCELRINKMMLHSYDRANSSANDPLERWGDFLRDHRQNTTIQPLVIFLPASIRKFYITSKVVGQGFRKKDVVAMFKDFSELHAERLPNLKEIGVGYSNRREKVEAAGLRELHSRCKEADIKVSETMLKTSGILDA